ncbi:Gfo/Idh/MocA family oxidoreductase [Sagittula sp. NFXS13]|uniref:Gfo/Idh/MocA family protein n=1 Tax=Sagittula sp. NFXS13 TaxID=2819095 RepID=UPI0032DF2773
MCPQQTPGVSMTKTRIAVIGAGWISQEAFLPAVHQTDNAEVIALISGSAEQSRKLADFHDIPDVVSYEAMDSYLASGKVDAVYIATPNSLHADQAIRAAQAGCHVLVEKPLATTEAECQAMIDACETAGVHLMTAYRRHNEPGTIDMLTRIRDGEIGRPNLIMSAFTAQMAADNHRLSASHWGGPLQDLGVYCVNAIRHIFASEPTEVIAMQSFGDNDPRFEEVHQSMSATMRFPGGRLAQFTVSFGAEPRDMLHVIGSEGALALDPAFKFEYDVTRTLHRGETVVDRETQPSNDDFGSMITYFADCIQNGTTPENDGRDGLADVVILRAIERAAETGQPQSIDLPPRPSHPGPDTLRRVPRSSRRLVF